MCQYAFCCCASIQTISNCVQSCLTVSGSKAAKAYNFVLFVLSTIVAILLKFYGNKVALDWAGISVGCINGTTHLPFIDKDSYACSGNQVVYRIALGLIFYYLINLVLSVIHPVFHGWFLAFKWIILVATIVVSMLWIPTSFIDVYLDISRFVSVLFLFVQLILFIDFAYDIHKSIVHKIEECINANPEKSIYCNIWSMLYIFISLILVAISFTIIIYGYTQFRCSVHTLMLSISVVVLIIIAIMSSSQIGRGFLIGAGVMVYSSYLLFSTLSSNPNEKCNPYVSYETIWNYIIGIVITIASIGYSCFSIYNSVGAICSLILTIITCGLFKGCNNTGSNTAKKGILDNDPTNNSTDNNNNDKEKNDNDKYDSRGNLASFYIIMIFGTCYMAMTLTDWVSDSGLDPKSKNPTIGKINMYSKGISTILCVVLYMIGLCLPAVLKDYEFGD